jgi:phage portal protein BeeE
MFPSSQIGKKKVRFNFDGLLRGDTESRAAYYREMYNIRAINPNEIRKHEGMNPYEGGDKFGQPLASNSKEVEPTSPNQNTDEEDGQE